MFKLRERIFLCVDPHTTVPCFSIVPIVSHLPSCRTFGLASVVPELPCRARLAVSQRQFSQFRLSYVLRAPQFLVSCVGVSCGSHPCRFRPWHSRECMLCFSTANLQNVQFDILFGGVMQPQSVWFTFCSLITTPLYLH